jgi:hypothetical protein
MLISIVIPTRERADVLRYALASCLRIGDDAIEIVVSDNASQDHTAEVVAAAGDKRVRYARTPQRCSMRENFEFAVGQARGDYVFMMGDDDALIPNQFPFLRALLEEFRPDSLTGSKVAYAWPGDWPGGRQPPTAGRVKLLFRTTYGAPEVVSGAQLRADLESKGAVIKWDAPRIYGGAMSREAIERLRARSGQVFMASSPDIYATFAAIAVIDRHVKISHPFFVGAASPKSNGVNFQAVNRAGAPSVEYARFMNETKLDPLVDPITVAPTIQICELAMLEAANQHAYGGNLRVDYRREFDRALNSLREVDENQQAPAVRALARFADERGLPADLRDAAALASRCPAPRPSPEIGRGGRNRSFVLIDRVVIQLDDREPTDVDAAATVYERLLGGNVQMVPRLLAWLGLLGRAVSVLALPRLARPSSAKPARPTPAIFAYLCFGKSPSLRRELAYSVATLLAELDGDASRIAIFTDRPQDFAGWPQRIVDISDRLATMMWDGEGLDPYRAKPAALVEALRLFQRDCVLLDADTFVRPGFIAAVDRALAAGAAMNAFVRAGPYPFFGPFETDLPNIGRYCFDPAAPMLNSGLVAARIEHVPLIEDALTLMERLLAAKLNRHDIEQFAVGECFRTAGVEVALIDRELTHYCHHWAKRYMRRRLRRRMPSIGAPPVAIRPDIPLSKTRTRQFKVRVLARLAWRAAWRRAAGARSKVETAKQSSV